MDSTKVFFGVLVLWIALLIGTIYVAVHFISKFW